MKKLYWSFMSLSLSCIVLDMIFVALNLKIATLITCCVMLMSIFVSLIIYFCFVKFRCQKCNTIFKGKFWEIFFAEHTPTKRKMHCPICNERVWCEDWFEKEKAKEKEDVK